jgi:hypothetical protein
MAYCLRNTSVTRHRPTLGQDELSGRAQQSGAISLLVAIILVLLAALASFYGARIVLADRLANHNQKQAVQARLTAEAALAWARADLQRQYAGSPTPPLWAAGLATAPCPVAYSGPRWQCVTLQPPTHPDLAHEGVQVLAVRDLINSPHVVELNASVGLSEGAARAKVQAQVFIPSVAPAPTHANSAAIVLNGCVAPANAAGSHLCTGQSCTTTAWNNVLGDITPEQVRAWSEAQARNGLTARSHPARNIYWVDSPATWIESLGTSDAPVLLVFSGQACAQRCPSMAAGVRVVGTVVLQTQCQDHKVLGWHAGHIEGQLVVESGLPELQSGSRIEARALAQAPYRMPWPIGMDTRQVQRVPGSWREGWP